jgi:hypothetical protein
MTSVRISTHLRRELQDSSFARDGSERMGDLLEQIPYGIRGLRRRSSAARLLRLWFRIPPGAWMSVCCECCVLSGRGLCDGLITRPEESYRLWRVVVCDHETSNTRRLKPATGL